MFFSTLHKTCFVCIPCKYCYHYNKDIRIEKKQVLNLPHKFKDLNPYYCKNYKNTTIYYIDIQVPKYFFKNHNLPKTFRKSCTSTDITFPEIVNINTKK